MLAFDIVGKPEHQLLPRVHRKVAFSVKRGAEAVAAVRLPEKNLLGFAADDSYCLYAESGGEIEYCASVFLNDWAWNSRAFAQDGYLYIVDRREALVYTADTLENTASFPF